MYSTLLKLMWQACTTFTHKKTTYTVYTYTCTYSYKI